jgi:O-antigen/teichoic acid export membrane protein
MTDRATGASRETIRASVWNFAALTVIAVAGLTANFWIAGRYGPEALGIFNQALALYVVGGQSAALGVHLWVQRASALVDMRAQDAPRLLAEIVLRGGCAVAITGSAVIAAGMVLPSAIATLFGSEALGQAWQLALPGLICFALNKVMLAFAVGTGRFRLYAVGQAGRPVLFLTALAVWIALDLPGEQVAIGLSIAEALLCVGLIGLLGRPLLAARRGVRVFAVKEPIAFGMRALPGMAFGDLNTRVDVLVLGIFASDATVGVYSIAALIAEGILQIAVVVRVLVNPSLARALAAGDTVTVAVLANRAGVASAASVAAAFIVALLALDPIARDLLHDPAYAAALLPLTMLAIGMSIGAWRLPMDQVFVQAGRPGAYSLLKGATLAANIALCGLLVPSLGMTGAGLGYGSSFVVYILLLRSLVRQRLNIRL